MRIAVLAYDAINAKYRAYMPARELAARGHDVHYEATTAPVKNGAALMDYDVVLIYRHVTVGMHRLAQSLRDAGVAVVWDNDDQLTGLSKDHPLFKELGGLKGETAFASIRTMLQTADLVTTPSAVLAERYVEAGAREARVIENYLPEEFLHVDRRPHEGVIVGWTAAAEHVIEERRMHIGESLTRLLDRFPELEVVTIGIRLDIINDRYRNIRQVDFAELVQAVAAFDIGIAPIADDSYSVARSNVKVKEYAAAGVPWLASERGAYLGLGERQGGRLVADDAWEEEIAQLVDSRRKREKLGKRAAKWAKQQAIAHHVQRWEEALEEAVAHARSRH